MRHRFTQKFGKQGKLHCKVTQTVKCCLCDTALWQLSFVLEGFVRRIKSSKVILYIPNKRIGSLEEQMATAAVAQDTGLEGEG